MPRIYINGKFHDKEDAKVSVYDHGLLYGDGVFEGHSRLQRPRCSEHKEHIDRLYESAKHIALEIPLTPAEMTEGCRGHGQGEREDRRLHSVDRYPWPRQSWASIHAVLQAERHRHC